MMNRMWAAVCGVGLSVVVGAVPALAQGVDAGKGSVGVVAGVQSVENVGGLFGVQLAWQMHDRIDVIGEGVWLQDVVTRRRVQTAQTIATYLQQTQGQSASADLEAPAWFFGAGARAYLTAARAFRPYIVVEGGAARVTLTPTVTLGGSDVTTNLPSYGVSLGEDLTGSFTKPAFTFGAGVVNRRGAWEFDAGVKVTSIQTDEQVTNVLRAQVGIARRF